MTTIKATRQKLGCTQKQIAPLLGMTQQGVGRIETGYEGRKETNGHRHILLLIEFIADHGLLDELRERLGSEIQKTITYDNKADQTRRKK